MKNTFTLLMSTFIVAGIYAQPTLTAGDIPKVGDKYTVHEFDASGIAMGDAGANKTWDFSSLPAGSDTYVLEVTDAGKHTYGYAIPESEIVITNNYWGSRNLSSKDHNFHFYSLNGNQFIKQGRLDESSSGSTQFTNDFGDTEIQYSYPITYKSKHSDTWNGGFNSFGMQIDWVNGKTEYEADGYGTLKIPGRTFKNVLRLKRTRSYTSQTNSSSNEWKLTMYEWYVKGVPFPILSLFERTTNGGDPTFQGHVLDVAELQGVGIKANENYRKDFKVYPNPAAGLTTLSFILEQSSVVRISIFDIAGKELTTYGNGKLKAGTHQQKIDVSSLKPGFYFIAIQIDEERIMKKISVSNVH